MLFIAAGGFLSRRVTDPPLLPITAKETLPKPSQSSQARADLLSDERGSEEEEA